MIKDGKKLKKSQKMLSEAKISEKNEFSGKC